MIITEQDLEAACRALAQYEGANPDAPMHLPWHEHDKAKKWETYRGEAYRLLRAGFRLAGVHPPGSGE